MKTSPRPSLRKAHGALLLGLLAATALHAGTPVPQVNGLFRVLKADGSTVLGQAIVTPSGGTLATISVNQKDALVAANGRCAFNVKYDEVATAVLKGSVNRLYSNDTLIAQNTGIDLQPGVLRTIWTQPYLYAGPNNVKVMFDAGSANPGVGWLRIYVAGDCKATSPPPPPPPPPAVTPASAGWNALYVAWGYSNYATKQLKTKGYSRYAELAKVNADLRAVVAARQVSQSGYDTLMARWNALAGDPAFKALMSAVVPSSGRI